MTRWPDKKAPTGSLPKNCCSWAWRGWSRTKEHWSNRSLDQLPLAFPFRPPGLRDAVTWSFTNTSCSLIRSARAALFVVSSESAVRARLNRLSRATLPRWHATDRRPALEWLAAVLNEPAAWITSKIESSSRVSIADRLPLCRAHVARFAGIAWEPLELAGISCDTLRHEKPD